MLIFPAIDLLGGEAVRLYKGDYAQKTVYSQNPVGVALDFARAGARCAHIVDLEGAKTGETPAFEIIKQIKQDSGLFIEVGGGIRSIRVIEKYLSAGIDRVIIGTAAVTEPEFIKAAARDFAGQLAVGIDVLEGYVRVKGWTESSGLKLLEFCESMRDLGIQTIICTDISRDGALQGTNREMYAELQAKFKMNITASGGVSTLDDIRALKRLNMYGAIIGKAYYTGAIDLRQALEAAV